ncbi:MAG: murein biosynthesis integral membrane protein MurJ [Spirochaetota bacterium]
MSTKKTVKYIFSSSSGIFISRIFGLLRDTFVTHFFKPSTQDIFNAAFKVPNTFRSIFAEGAMTNSYIPILKSISDKKEQEEFQSNFFTVFILLLLIVTIILIIFVPFFMPYLVKGFDKFSPTKITSTIYLSRYLFTYLFIISLVSFFSSSMNAIFKFFIPSISQSVFNLVFIVVIVYFAIIKKISLELFIYAVVLGGIFQLLFVLFFSYRYGIKIRFKWPKKWNHIFEVFKLMGPSLITSATYQVNIFISTYFLSMFDGGQTYHYLAQRLFQLPIGLLAVAMAQVFLPSFSELVQKNDKELINSTLRKSLQLSFLFTIPISGLMIGLARPLVQIIFYHGAFSLNDVRITSIIFSYYMPGIIFITSSNMFTSLFYANRIWKSQVIVSSISILLFFLYIKIFTPIFGINAIAVANTLNTFTQLLMLFLLAKLILKISVGKENLIFALKTVFLTSILTLLLLYLNRFIGFSKTSFSLDFFIILLELVSFFIMFCILFYLGSKILRIEFLSEILNSFIKKIKK